MNKMLCALLSVSLALLPFTAKAGMIGTPQTLSVNAAQGERTTLLALIARPEVAQELAGAGIDPGEAIRRVSTMTDDEVQALVGGVNSLPAGQHVHAFLFVFVMFAVAFVIYWQLRKSPKS